MSGRILFMIIIISLASFISDIITSFLRKKISKKVNYDCSKCDVWDCPNKECLKHRKV